VSQNSRCDNEHEYRTLFSTKKAYTNVAYINVAYTDQTSSIQYSYFPEPINTMAENINKLAKDFIVSYHSLGHKEVVADIYDRLTK
jgi:hypothetical protein